MEDFLELKDMARQISLVGDEEPCGLLYLINGRPAFSQLKNGSETPNTHFVFKASQYAAYQLQTEIVAIVHGHKDNCIASKYDLQAMNRANIPYIIFNCTTWEYRIYFPESRPPIAGRKYNFGKEDCFSAARNWYFEHGILYKERNDNWTDENFWKNGNDYIGEFINQFSFTEVTDQSLKYGDLLIFSVGTDIYNHLGVYEENDMFFHHAYNRISCSENLYENQVWARSLVKVYRNEESKIIRDLRG